jgi:hypothetical protein
MSRAIAQTARFLGFMALVIGAAGIAPSCAGGGGSGDDAPPADGAPGVDAPVSSDAPTGCSVDVEFDQTNPTAGVGNTISANAIVINATGGLDYAWDVRDPTDNALPLSPDAASQTVTFAIETPGDYQVRLIVTSSVGDFCPTYDEPLHVLAPGANSTTWRIRIVPDETIEAPPQEVIRSIPSSPSIDIGDIILEAGVPVATTVVDQGGGGIRAYVRVTSATSALAVEAYADATGAFSTNIPVGVVDALVVPESPNLPPVHIASWPGTSITVTPGIQITGTVRDPSGAPLAGAVVSLRVDGVPSTVDTTNINGVYTLRARGGATTEVFVAPTDASGLPRLSATLAAAPSSPLDIDYDAAVTTRNLTGTILQYDGAAAPNARVTFTGDIGPAGAVTMGAANAIADGDVLIVAVANGSGVLPTTRAPARMVNAVVVADVVDAAVVAIDLSAGAPGTIDAPAAVPLTARVVGPATELIEGSIVTAIPVGALALGAGAPAFGVTAADGTVSVPLASGATYDLVIDDPDRDWSRQWMLAVSGGALGDVSVEPAMRVSGTIKKPGGAGGARSSSVQVFCYACSGIAAQRAVGESATGQTGQFSLVVTDPGSSSAAAADLAMVQVAFPGLLEWW